MHKRQKKTGSNFLVLFKCFYTQSLTVRPTAGSSVRFTDVTEADVAAHRKQKRCRLKRNEAAANYVTQLYCVCSLWHANQQVINSKSHLNELKVTKNWNLWSSTALISAWMWFRPLCATNSWQAISREINGLYYQMGQKKMKPIHGVVEVNLKRDFQDWI